jgi:multidrug efflux pump subunit AcrA (membrane-fusion protein)
MRLQCLVAWLTPLVLASSGCYPKSDSGPSEPLVRAVEVRELRHERAAEVISLIGSIEPWREATLYFEVSGVIEEVLVEEGDHVEPGDPIARLVLDDYELAVSQAEAELNAAQAKLDLLHAGTRKEDLDAAQADYSRASVRADYWTNELTRALKLHREDSLSASKRDEIRREYDAAVQEKNLAEAQLKRAEAGPRKEEIDATAATADSRQQALELAKRQLNKATLRSPISGRVEKRLVDPGAYVNVFPMGGVPVVKLVDLDQVDAVIAVPESMLPDFADRSEVSIVSAIDSQIRGAGKTVSVGQVADSSSGTYELRARMVNPDHRFKGGTAVIAETTRPLSQQVIRVPVTALCRAYGQAPYVLLVEPENSQVVAREVKVGPLQGDRVEVWEGLGDGDLLIVRGHDRVVVGDQVKYRSEGPGAATPAQ